MISKTEEFPVKSLLILHDDKFVSGRLSRKLLVESNLTLAPECYHAGAQATVPFMWESEPGTPKRRLIHTSVSLPPLTPPPSYFFNSASTTPVKKHTTRVHFNNYGFPKFSFSRSLSAVRLSSSSENSIQSLSSPSSLSSTSPSVVSFQMTPLCDYYYSRRYGFAFEAEEECIRSSSSYLSIFACFLPRKLNNQKNAKKSGGYYSNTVRRFIGTFTS